MMICQNPLLAWRKSSVGCQVFGHVLHMTNESTVFTAMPLFHSTAALLGACAILSHGGCLALSHKFSASTFWKQVYLTGATHIQYVGEVCRYLLHTPISKYEKMHKVKVAYGNGLRPDIWQDFRKRFNIEVIGESMPQLKLLLLQLPSRKVTLELAHVGTMVL